MGVLFKQMFKVAFEWKGVSGCTAILRGSLPRLWFLPDYWLLGAPAAAKPPAAAPSEDFQKQHAAELDNPALKKDLKLLWFATGSEDFLVGTSKASVEMLKKHGFFPVYKESPGGHTWINWRSYLNEFAPQLFR